MIHRLLHGHRPVWEKYGYDFLSYRLRCLVCVPNGRWPYDI